jgi:hypothetical protein
MNAAAKQLKKTKLFLKQVSHETMQVVTKSLRIEKGKLLLLPFYLGVAG